MQTISETVPVSENPSWKYIVCITENARRRSKVVVSLLHSLVQTASFTVSSATGVQYGHEEAILPPIGIETTDAECISKALVFALEQRLFGSSLEDWLSKLTWVSLLLFLVAMDSAASNILALTYLVAQFMLSGVLTLCWLEHCNVHQLMRLAVVVSKHAELQPAVKSMSKVLRLCMTGKSSKIRSSPCGRPAMTTTLSGSPTRHCERQQGAPGELASF